MRTPPARERSEKASRHSDRGAGAVEEIEARKEYKIDVTFDPAFALPDGARFGVIRITTDHARMKQLNIVVTNAEAPAPVN